MHDEALDMLLTQPQPQSLEPYYQSEDYISHTDASGGLINGLYQTVKKRALNRKMKLVLSLGHPKTTLLDVGAGTGDFVLAARKRGWQAEGVEPMEIARDNAKAKGVTLKKELALLAGQEFQVITLWHVLEHLPDLDAQIDRILSHLEPDGSLILALPNFKSWDARHYKTYWAAYDVPRHLWHFSRKSVKRLFRAKGFEVTRVTPLWFDAFYVALLSEKYKNGKVVLWKAFLNGLRSNLSALATGEYSSLIYVLQRAKKPK